MCNAFSCIVHKNGKVYWKAGIDSHDKLMEEFNLSRFDNTYSVDDMVLAKVEITPPSEDYGAILDVECPQCCASIKDIIVTG